MRPREQILDEWLVLRSQAGDQSALDLLVERWHPGLVRLARHLTRSNDAEEIAQEAWLAVARGIQGLQDPARFGAWARRIVVHKSRDWIRRQKRQRQVMDDAASEQQHGASTARAEPRSTHQADDVQCGTQARLRSALAGLPEARRVILEMFYVEGLSVREIASILNVPVGTVKSRLFHARQTLRQSLEEDHETERN